MVDAGGAGFVTVWPSGTSRPNVSNLNLEFAGQTIPNAVIVASGQAGSNTASAGFDIFTLSSAHLIVDVVGSFPPAG